MLFVLEQFKKRSANSLWKSVYLETEEKNMDFCIYEILLLEKQKEGKLDILPSSFLLSLL